MQKHVKQLKNEKGMTLVELLAVLVILAIIAAIAIPMIGNAISESRQKGELNDALNIIAAAKLADANGQNTATENTYTKDDLTNGGYLDEGSSTFTNVKKAAKQWEITGFTFEYVKSFSDKTTVTEKDIKNELKKLTGETTTETGKKS